jgi:uncharacterized membrane protein YhaH (DUF805 family)
LPDLGTISWFFFGYSGRVGRQSYALGGVLLYMARLYPVYRMIMAPDEAAQSFWSGIFLVVICATLVAHVALSAKRLHDMGRSGWWACLFILGDILMYLFLCFPPGTPGPNRYGSQTDAPR